MNRSSNTVHAARPSVGTRAVGWRFALPALLCAAAGLWISWHHPLVSWAMALPFIAVCAFSWAWPGAWLLVLPALLPVVDLAPWSGWIVFEEFDLLVLAVAAGGFARLAFRVPQSAAGPAHAEQEPRGGGALVGLMVWLFAASVLLSMARGFADAGGFSFGWYQGYREPMNSVRLAKGFFEALLLYPLWSAARRRAPETARSSLTLGITLGLLAASLAALWERLAFTGLLDFSSDYRTTAMFWEMHVGGAAFDGFLALSLPFALHQLLSPTSRRRWLTTAFVTLLACYACLTTFSRGLYLALLIGAALTCGLHLAGRVGAHRGSTGHRLRSAAMLLAGGAAFAGAVAWTFPTSGYRGILALLGAVAILLPLVTTLRSNSRAHWWAGLSLGAVLSILAAASSPLLPKGPYVAYALGFALAVAALVLQRGSEHRLGKRYGSRLAMAGFVCVLTCTGLVAAHWGGEAAMQRTLPVIAALLAIAALAGSRSADPWPSNLRWQASAVGTMAVASGVVGAFAGGGYMSDRFSTSSEDFGARWQHWRQGIDMLETPADVMLGKGLGRYIDNYALKAPMDKLPGDYRLREDGQNAYLALVAGTHVMGWGELLRVSQRVTPPVGATSVSFDLRVAQPVMLDFDLCLKHLLYDAGCLIKRVHVAAGSDAWQPMRIALDGDPLHRGVWYAPKLAAFSIATENPGVRVEVDNLVVAGADGRNLLTNGDFSNGLARWFFTSDRNHLPWHVKNMALNVLFEQGAIGLALWSTLVIGATWRVTVGRARHDGLAPSIAGALISFSVVGLFDSLLDAPRVAFLFYFLLLLTLSLREPAVRAHKSRHQMIS